RGAEDVATCVTFPDTLLHPLGKRAEHFDKAPLFMITLYKSGEMVPIGVPDKSNPTAPPIGIYVTRL
ncbi:MAG: hypothetical protein NT149_04120, partial [Candidatus Gottesmanbacteria bacterium]|nr:hypothetical protein [Candidatus Gottesmanbacteria bacterium]